MARNHRTFLGLAVFLALLVAVLAACASAPPASPAPAGSAATPAAAPAAPAKVTEYVVTAITDATGPSAENMKTVDAARKVLFGWWNDARGKELGIRLNLKFIDGRSDPGLIASAWAGALASDKPIAISGAGGSDVTALQQRLPADKVPMFNGSGANGFAWVPDQWIFNGQATYAHYVAGFLNWYQANWKEGRPIRIGQVSSEQYATTKDAVNGVQNAFDKGLLKSKVEYAGVEWTPMGNPDLSGQVRRLLDKKVDIIHTVVTPVSSVGIVRALQQFKADNVKMLYLFGSGMLVVASSTSLAEIEGYFQTTGYASSVDTNIEAYSVYQQSKDKFGASAIPFDDNVVWGLIVGVLPLQAVERAAKTVGADKITGEAIYNAMLASPVTGKETLGLTSDLRYTKEAPFPTTGLKARITTVKGGKVQLATSDWVTVPEIPKW